MVLTMLINELYRGGRLGPGLTVKTSSPRTINDIATTVWRVGVNPRARWSVDTERRAPGESPIVSSRTEGRLALPSA